MIASLWSRLPFGRKKASPLSMPSLEQIFVPEHAPVYAIGDVHGYMANLRQAIEWITHSSQSDLKKGHKPKVIFLGDYIDRGPDSRGVIETLTRLPVVYPELEWICLAGNHEATALEFLREPTQNESWLDFGGQETLLSYGVTPPMDATPRELNRAWADFQQALPASHRSFLQDLPVSHQHGDYFFVHAGVRPNIPLKQQRSEDMLWIRGDFLQTPHWHGKCVVHGHTIEPEPTILPWRIGIDSGVYTGQPLTCLALHGNQQRTIRFTGK